MAWDEDMERCSIFKGLAQAKEYGIAEDERTTYAYGFSQGYRDSYENALRDIDTLNREISRLKQRAQRS